ncbi:MAG: hypothetical protein Kow0069_37800 [Promethearchaeota archaeon]
MFIATYVTSRLLLTLIPGYVHDFIEYAAWGRAVLAGTSLYSSFPNDPQGYFIIKYPPLHSVLSALIVAVFGSASLSFKLGIWAFELATLPAVRWSWLAWTNGGGGEANSGKDGGGGTFPGVATWAYCFNPVTTLVWLHGYLGVFGAFFLAWGVLACLRDHDAVCGALLAAGFLCEFFPAFLAVPLAAWWSARRKWRSLGAFALGFGVTAVLISLPFFASDVAAFVHNFVVHLSRVPQAVSYWTVLLGVLPDWNLAVGGVQVGWIGMAFVGFTASTFFAAHRFFRSRPEAGKGQVVQFTGFFFLCMPLVFLSLFFRYFFWGMPVWCAELPKRESRRLSRLAVACTLMLVPFTAFALAFWNDFSFTMVELYDVDPNFSLFLTQFHQLTLVFQLLAWLAFSGPIRFEGAGSGPSPFQVFSISLACLFFQVCTFLALYEAIKMKWLVGLGVASSFLANLLVATVKSLERGAGSELEALLHEKVY